MKELKIFLTNYKTDLVKKSHEIQNLFGGDTVRKPNFFGYFLRVGICPEKNSIFIYTNRFDNKDEIYSCLDSKIKDKNY